MDSQQIFAMLDNFNDEFLVETRTGFIAPLSEEFLTFFHSLEVWDIYQTTSDGNKMVIELVAGPTLRLKLKTVSR